MKRLLIGSAILISIFLISSCNDTGFFLDETEEETFIIDSIEEGAVLKSTDEISVSLDYDESLYDPDSLEIVLKDQDGNTIGSKVLSGNELIDPLPPVSLPEMEAGLYAIHYTVKSGDEIIAEAEFPFFYSDETFLVQGIGIYPPVILPGGSGLLKADMYIPGGTNPFLRWSTGDLVIHEGFLNEGADGIEWEAPSIAGVYSILLEVFPYGSEDPAFYSFSSSLYHEAVVYVGEKQGTAKSDLLPPESYYSLYHFKGSPVNSGIWGSEHNLALQAIGTPTLDMQEGVFGYFLDGLSGFLTEESLIPANSPFSMTFRFLLDGEQSDCTFMAVEDVSGGVVIRLFTDNAGDMFLELSTNYDRIVIPSGITSERLNTTKELTASVIPGDTMTDIRWFCDGYFIDSQSLPFVFTLPESGDYRSRIGGEGGFCGILDEFGVYSRNQAGETSEEQGIFKRTMANKYGRNLVAAEGFDDVVSPEGFDISGSYYFETGSLVLENGGSLAVSDLPVENGELIFRMGISSSDDTGVFSLRNSIEGDVLSLKIDAVPGTLLADEEGCIQFVISRDTDGSRISIDGGEEMYPLEGSFRTLNLMIESGDETGVIVKSLLIYKTTTQIADGDTETDLPVGL